MTGLLTKQYIGMLNNCGKLSVRGFNTQDEGNLKQIKESLGEKYEPFLYFFCEYLASNTFGSSYQIRIHLRELVSLFELDEQEKRIFFDMRHTLEKCGIAFDCPPVEFFSFIVTVNTYLTTNGLADKKQQALTTYVKWATTHGYYDIKSILSSNGWMKFIGSLEESGVSLSRTIELYQRLNNKAQQMLNRNTCKKISRGVALLRDHVDPLLIMKYQATGNPETDQKILDEILDLLAQHGVANDL